MRILTLTALAGIGFCGATAPAAAGTKTVCVETSIAKNANVSCADYCKLALASGPNSDFLQSWGNGVVQPNIIKPVPPAVVLPPRPTNLSSCTPAGTTQPLNGPAFCWLKICGPESASLRDSVSPYRGSVTGPATGTTFVPPCGQPGNPCPRKPSAMVGPGLLEGDSGFAQQGPAAAGTASPTPAAPTGARGTVVYSRP